MSTTDLNARFHGRPKWLQSVKGLKSRLLTDLIRLLGMSPPGIGYTIERAELIAKDNKY